MKTLKKSNLLLSALLLLMLSSCGKIPEAYRGSFVDQPSGTKLVLGSSEGKLTAAGGQEISAKADALQFDALTQAKAGIYTRPMAGNEKLMEVFWIVPDAASRQENSGFVWFTSEILYTRMLADLKDPVQSLQLEHCKDGMLMLDLPTQTWNGGCGANTVPMTFTRVKE